VGAHPVYPTALLKKLGVPFQARVRTHAAMTRGNIAVRMDAIAAPNVFRPNSPTARRKGWRLPRDRI
jgi:hypothetical protein